MVTEVEAGATTNTKIMIEDRIEEGLIVERSIIINKEEAMGETTEIIEITEIHKEAKEDDNDTKYRVIILIS